MIDREVGVGEVGVGADLDTIRSVLELITAHRIRFSYAGSLDLTPEEVLFCLQNPEAFEAWTSGGTVDQLRAWYHHDWKCRAHTRSQRRCKNWVAVVEQGRCYNAPEPGFGELEEFHPYDPEFLFCRLHLARITPSEGGNRHPQPS
jgi:hypothetical protein